LAAEDAAKSKSIDERVTDLETSLGALADFQLSGMAYGSWLYNFNRPDNRVNSLRSLDQEHNSLSLDLFQLGIGKKGPAGLSFASKLDFGKTASRIGANWKGDGGFDGITNNGGDTLLGNVTICPSKMLLLSASGTFGPEQKDTNSNSRGIIDLVSIITFDPVTLNLNFDYGHEGDAALSGGSEKWYGFAGIVG